MTLSSMFTNTRGAALMPAPEVPCAFCNKRTVKYFFQLTGAKVFKCECGFSWPADDPNPNRQSPCSVPVD